MKILVTTDGSPKSLGILPHAEEFASATESVPVLLRVLDPKKDVRRKRGVPVHKAVQHVRDEWKEQLAATLDSASLPIEPVVDVMRSGERVHEAILRVADGLEAGMIALASRGSNMVRRAVLGSVATRVLGCSTLPIFVGGPDLKEPGRYRQYRILATSDGSPASRQVLDAIDPFLKSGAIDVELLRVYVATVGDQEEPVELARCRRQMAELRAHLAADVRVRCHVSALGSFNVVENEILDRAEQMRVRAIAMSTHGHSAAHQLLLGSTAFGILARSPVPAILARSESTAGCR